MKKNIFAFVLFLLFIQASLVAQTTIVPATNQPAYPSTFFGLGGSYSNIEGQRGAGSFIEGKLLTSTSSTQPAYSFTIEDFIPVKGTDKKIHIDSLATTGIATILRDLGGVGKTWIIGTIGGGSTQTKSGLAYTGGGAWSRTIKGSVFSLLSFRYVKVANSDNQFVITETVNFGGK